MTESTLNWVPVDPARDADIQMDILMAIQTRLADYRVDGEQLRADLLAAIATGMHRLKEGEE